MLAVLALAPAHHSAHSVKQPGLVAWRPSVQARFASALRALGEDPRATGFAHGTLLAVVQSQDGSAVPFTRIDAAIAASHVVATCRCEVARYRIIAGHVSPFRLWHDPLLPNQALIAVGRPSRRAESLADLHDARRRMDGASDAAISARAADLVASVLRSSSTRATAVIVRDGEIVFSFAYRPATHAAAIWAVPSISLPSVPPPARIERQLAEIG